ncbi:MAG TPA: protease complex subunit PrcB family protein [Gemmatimonadaceae bacterium]|nr:protease complex subunit PrcB family protein [Gemmatimonadaceae bacterium]
MRGSRDRLSVSLAAFALVALACGTSPKAPESVDASPAREGPLSPDIHICCPRSDSAIYALMAEYERTPPDRRPPELAILFLRVNGGQSTRVRMPIRDAATWRDVWTRLNTGHSPVQPLPDVDFAREMLILVGMGSRSTGGYSIAIDDITIAGRDVDVWVTEWSPGPRCGTTQAFTSPIALARLPRADGALRFHESQRVVQC